MGEPRRSALERGGGRAPALRVSGVSKSYGRTHALRDVSLELAPGEVVALLGPNGAGKTTLISLVAGLRRPDAGSVFVYGLDVSRRAREARRCLGIAPQEFGVHLNLTVRENLVFFGELYRLRGRALHRRVDEVAHALGLSDLMTRPSTTLSGGEKRRLHTAMALVHSPRLALLDEPTAGVDVRTRAALLELVRDLAHDGVAVCYCTHYLEEIEALPASLAILHRGRLVARGSAASVLSRFGRFEVELRFDGPAPAIELECPKRIDGSILTLVGNPKPPPVASVLSALGAATEKLVSLEVRRPDLRSAFVALTSDDGGPGGRDAAAPDAAKGGCRAG